MSASNTRPVVLLAEDDRESLHGLARTLSELGPEIELVAASGAEALEVVRARPVDLLVTKQKLVLLTAGTDPQELVSTVHGALGGAIGGTDTSRPWRPVELVGAVRQALASVHLRRERDALLGHLERRLQAMTALVDLSTQAAAPRSQRQLLDLVRTALRRIVPYDVAALLLVPPGTTGPGHALLLLVAGDENGTTESRQLTSDGDRLLADVRDRCVAVYNARRGGVPLDPSALVVQTIGAGRLRGRDLGLDVGQGPGRAGELRAAIGRDDAERGEGVLGALYVASADHGAYTADDAQNLDALAALTAELSRRLFARVEDERRRMELMVASMADGVIMTDQAGEIFVLNPAARRMLGLPPPEAEGPAITAQFLKDRLGFYPFELVRAARAGDGPVREEVRIGDQYLHSIVSPVIDGSGQMVGVVVVLRDITEQKALESRKEEFVSIVSHELRTPLTSIGGALELLVEQYDEGLTDKQRRYIQMARESSQKLNRIVDDLLDVARAERGSLRLKTGTIDLGEMLLASAERFRGAAEQKHVQLKISVTGPVRLTADADRLTQVLSNLLSNAIKFTPEGGRIEAEAYTSTATDELVGLSVWNSGPAIGEADRERVFDKFEQVQQSSTRRVGGTGLGLAICRAIIERHGGQIWVEPTPGSTGGARFVFTLPVEAHEVSETVSETLANPKTVLIVDDDRRATWLLKGALLAARHHVLLAEDADTALQLARERRPDLVSVDLQMPATSGAELVEILRHDPETRKLPVLVVSGHAAGANVGADATLRKPVSLSELRETVLDLLSEAGNLRRRVLVVDDDAAIRLICREVLEAHGFLVREAENGEGALAEARRFRPDLVLVDVMMPEIDGFELAQRLHGERETALVPIIFVSARGQTADKVRAFKLGAEDYLVKPFDSSELVARVEKALLRRDFDLGASPTTRLPGSAIIEKEIDRRLRERGHFAFCYLDLDNLKAFNDYYGYAKADAVIKQTGDIIREAVGRHGGPGDFIGHIAGDDFVLITTIETVDAVCEGVIEAFDRLVPLYYNRDDRDRGYIEAQDRFGVHRKFPLMSVSIACVTDGKIRTHAELSTAAAELKQKAKAIVGSSYVRDAEVRFPRP